MLAGRRSSIRGRSQALGAAACAPCVPQERYRSSRPSRMMADTIPGTAASAMRRRHSASVRPRATGYWLTAWRSTGRGHLPPHAHNPLTIPCANWLRPARRGLGVVESVRRRCRGWWCSQLGSRQCSFIG
jgi:hypothetical protein